MHQWSVWMGGTDRFLVTAVTDARWRCGRCLHDMMGKHQGLRSPGLTMGHQPELRAAPGGSPPAQEEDSCSCFHSDLLSYNSSSRRWEKIENDVWLIPLEAFWHQFPAEDTLVTLTFDWLIGLSLFRAWTGGGAVRDVLEHLINARLMHFVR